MLVTASKPGFIRSKLCVYLQLKKKINIREGISMVLNDSSRSHTKNQWGKTTVKRKHEPALLKVINMHDNGHC